MSRTMFIIVSSLMLLMLIVTTGCQQLPASMSAAPVTVEASTEAAMNRTITVVGTGSAFVEPDVARAAVGVNVTAPTIEEASDEVNQRMSSVMEALDAAGIAPKDIQTSDYSIYFEEPPRFEMAPASAEDQPQGQYRVSNQVRITIRELDRVGEILDSAVSAGANNVFGVTFTREDAQAARSEARVEAVKNAKAKAQEYAQLNDLTLGSVISVSEVVGGGTPFEMPAAAEGLGGGGPSISPGQLEVQVQIQITYVATQ
jgi:uncharacterized protein YggE